MDRYANSIVGQLFGHTHQDSFQIMRSEIPGEIAGVALEHPSLTTEPGLHPSYRIYHMDRTSYALADYEQYRMNMTKANLEDKPEWKLAYKFREYYKEINCLSDLALARMAETIKVYKE